MKSNVVSHIIITFRHSRDPYTLIVFYKTFWRHIYLPLVVSPPSLSLVACLPISQAFLLPRPRDLHSQIALPTTSRPPCPTRYLSSPSSRLLPRPPPSLLSLSPRLPIFFSDSLAFTFFFLQSSTSRSALPLFRFLWPPLDSLHLLSSFLYTYRFYLLSFIFSSVSFSASCLHSVIVILYISPCCIFVF